MVTDTFDIQELVQKSGVPRRTIYFYVQQGILPPPEGAGLAAYYTTEHLQRLRLIPILRSQGLRLDEIRKKFETMTADQMQKLIADSHAIYQVKAAPAPAAGSVIQPGIYPLIQPPRQFNHFSFPGEITISAPANLSPDMRQKLDQLNRAAAQIFGRPGPFFAENNNGNSSESV